MKHLEYTRKYLLEDLGCEEFKFAGEYLFCGKAEIYIDRGDDDIIKFHDGKHFIRFICSQRDLTFYYKGDLDMLRISDVLDFDIKIISERFSFKEDELLKILGEIRDGVDDIKKNSIACCKETNKNLTALLEQMKKCCDKKKEVVPEPKPEPEEPKPEEPKEPEKPKEFVCKPMTLKIENGKFVADVPEEYKNVEEFALLELTEQWSTVSSTYLSLEDVLNYTPIESLTYKLGFKESAEGWCYGEAGFQCFSNEVVFNANEEPTELVIEEQVHIYSGYHGSGSTTKTYTVKTKGKHSMKFILGFSDDANLPFEYKVRVKGVEYGAVELSDIPFLEQGDVVEFEIPKNLSPNKIWIDFPMGTKEGKRIVVKKLEDDIRTS